MIYIVLLVFVMFFIWLTVKLLNPPIPDRSLNVKDEDIIKLVKEGKRLQAIKWYRDLHGVGLKEAKIAIEQMNSK